MKTSRTTAGLRAARNLDSAVVAAARALSEGDVVSALQLVSLRSDPPALALRGVAMAQLGELAKARELLRRARRAFGRSETLARARCVVAEAEISLAMREFGPAAGSLAAAEQELRERGDSANAFLLRLIVIRRLLLLGRLDDADRELAQLGDVHVPAALAATAELLRAPVALRTLRTAEAASALSKARAAAHVAGIPALRSEVAAAHAALRLPAARRRRGGQEGLLLVSRASRHPSRRCWPTERGGPRRRWRSRWAGVNGRCNARWRTFRPQATCTLSARGDRSAGWPGFLRHSRQYCYSPSRWPLHRVHRHRGPSGRPRDLS